MPETAPRCGAAAGYFEISSGRDFAEFRVLCRPRIGNTLLSGTGPRPPGGNAMCRAAKIARLTLALAAGGCALLRSGATKPEPARFVGDPARRAVEVFEE